MDASYEHSDELPLDVGVLQFIRPRPPRVYLKDARTIIAEP